MLAASFRVASERSASRSPDRFLKFPIDHDSGVCKERADEIFGAPWGGDKFGEDRGGHGEISALESGFERGGSGRGHPWALIPQSDKDVRVDRGCHDQSMLPRISRSHRLMAFLPEGIPGFPIPAYLANTLLLLTGRICPPLLSLSKSTRSPAPPPRSRRG